MQVYFELFDKYFDFFAVNFPCINFTYILLFIKLINFTNSTSGLPVSKLSGNKVLCSRCHTAMFVVSFANLNLMYYLNPLGDHLMPCTKVYVTAQASHGNITVLSHLKVEKSPYTVPHSCT